MVGEAGVGLDMGLAYRQLQALGGCAVADVEHVLGVRPGVATSLIADLWSWGLVTISEGQVVPTPLASAVSLTRQVEAAGVEQKRQNGAHSARRLRHLISDALTTETVGSDALRVVRGVRAVESELLAATILCVRENLSTADTVFGQHPYQIGLEEDQLDSLLHRRTSRELCLRGAGYLTGGIQRRLAGPVTYGATYRCSPATPMRMEIFDRRIAFLPLDPDDLDQGAFAVRSPTVLALLCRIFFDLWASGEALAVPEESQRPAGLSVLQLGVLSGLAEGHTDARIARGLSVSRSTVTRAVREMHTLLRTESRFQLALRAASEGWLDTSGLVAT